MEADRAYESTLSDSPDWSARYNELKNIEDAQSVVFYAAAR